MLPWKCYLAPFWVLPSLRFVAILATNVLAISVGYWPLNNLLLYLVCFVGSYPCLKQGYVKVIQIIVHKIYLFYTRHLHWCKYIENLPQSELPVSAMDFKEARLMKDTLIICHKEEYCKFWFIRWTVSQLMIRVLGIMTCEDRLKELGYLIWRREDFWGGWIW